MMELKEAYEGQLGDIGKGVALAHFVTQLSSRITLTNPIQVCVRIEEHEQERIVEFCKSKSIKPISLMGMILQAAVKEFLDYDKSLKDAGILNAFEEVHCECGRAEEAQEQAEEAYQREELAKEKEAKEKGKKMKKVSIDLKE